MKHEFKNKFIYSNDNLIRYIRSHMIPGSTLLDLGCGPKVYSQAVKDLTVKQTTVDAWADVEPDILADLEKYDVKTGIGNVDYILMIDFIEHLEKSSGQRLLEDCKKIVNKKIFLLTPLEPIWNDNHKNVNNPELWCYGNNYDLHKSLWTEDDFMGFTQVQMYSLENYFLGHWERHV
jgi:hypothetical protein